MTPRPAIDYTHKDFASLRQAMLELARFRLPEWTDRSPADLGVLLVDLFAFMGDVILYYQDRIASELFLPTATERRSVMNLLRLIGYELQPPVAAAAEMELTFKPPAPGAPTVVTIPRGAQFATKANGTTPQTFEYLGADLTIDLASAQVTLRDGMPVYAGLPLRQSRTIPDEVLGSSTGEPNQRFRLAQRPLIPESLVVEVDEGAGWVAWERRESLLYYTDENGRVTFSGPGSRDYTAQFDAEDHAWVVTGDGTFGMRPPPGANNVRARYQVGGGAAGNVAAGTITDIKSTLPFLDSVTNPLPAAGGTDRESVEHAARFGPLAFRSGQRAVTLTDYVALAHQAGGVAKVRARARGWNQIDLYVAPEGDTCRPVPEALKQRILAFFEERRMVGTVVSVLDPICVPVEVAVEVDVDPHFRADAVRTAVENAVRGVLAYASVDFGQTLYLSDVYAAVESVAGVLAATVTRFRRHAASEAEVEAALQQLGLAAVTDLPEIFQRALRPEVAADGRIPSGEFEIPTLGDLAVTARGSAP